MNGYIYKDNKGNIIAHLIGHSIVNINFICTGKPKYPCELYCNICFIEGAWNQTRNLSKVCLYVKGHDFSSRTNNLSHTTLLCCNNEIWRFLKCGPWLSRKHYILWFLNETTTHQNSDILNFAYFSPVSSLAWNLECLVLSLAFSHLWVSGSSTLNMKGLL